MVRKVEKMTIKIQFDEWRNDNSIRSERKVTVEGDVGERQSDLTKLINTYPRIEATLQKYEDGRVSRIFYNI